MSNGFTPIALSASVGGAPVKLDSLVSPGKVIHANPQDSGSIDLVDGLMVVNPNSNTITLWFEYSGAGVPVFVDRRDIPATAEGKNIEVNLVPLLLEPGYTLNVWVVLQEGSTEPFLYGHVKRYPQAFQPGGYGGLNQTGSVILGDGVLDTGWDTYPWTGASVNNLVNVVQDPANNRFQINREGVWTFSVTVNIGFTSSNLGRYTTIRLYDETDGVAFETIPLYAGRDQEGALGVLSAILDVLPSRVGNWFRIEIGGGDTFTSVTAEGADLVLVRVGDS